MRRTLRRLGRGREGDRHGWTRLYSRRDARSTADRAHGTRPARPRGSTGAHSPSSRWLRRSPGLASCACSATASPFQPPAAPGGTPRHRGRLERPARVVASSLTGGLSREHIRRVSLRIDRRAHPWRCLEPVASHRFPRPLWPSLLRLHPRVIARLRRQGQGVGSLRRRHGCRRRRHGCRRRRLTRRAVAAAAPRPRARSRPSLLPRRRTASSCRAPRS